TPNEIVVLEVIRDLGLELHVVFNKGAVMVLPAGIPRASGLAAPLDRLRLSPRNVVAVGDAENDHSMLSFAEYAAAVGNAVPMLKEAADLVLANDNGEGVSELVDGLVAHDLTAPPLSPRRRTILLGHNDSGEEITIPPAGVNLLLAGSSGSGKSVLAIGVLERLGARGYQFCVIDPEGDYEVFPRVILLGGPNHAPAVPDILPALEQAAANVVVSLVGLRLQDRPAFFAALLPRLQELRVQTGRPHWLLLGGTAR